MERLFKYLIFGVFKVLLDIGLIEIEWSFQRIDLNSHISTCFLKNCQKKSYPIPVVDRKWIGLKMQ